MSIWVKIQIWCLALLVAASVGWMIFQWGECRDMGFPYWYCVQHIL